MSHCGEKYIYLNKKVGSLYYYCFVPSLCKSWNCPTCRPKKARIVQKYILDNFDCDDIYMLSFTLYHTGDASKSWGYISEYWNKLRTSVAKNSGKFTYLRVIEPHKDGRWPHMHVLIKGSDKIYELFEKSTRCGFGWNCHSRHVTINIASHYVTKYLTKEWPSGDAGFYRVLNKTRIVSVSRDLPAIFTHKSEWKCNRYDDMADRCTFYLNVLITLLKEQKAIYIESRSYCSGFILISDKCIDFSKVQLYDDPWLWEQTDNLNYISCEYGLQLEIKFLETGVMD